MPAPACAELIVALDVPSAAQATQAIRRLPTQLQYVKIGLELFISEGARVLEVAREANKRCFLDLKLHDIPRTVAHAVRAVAQHNIFMLTVHAQGGPAMLRAAAEAAAAMGAARPRLVAVTTLTSLNQDDLTQIGVTRPLAEHTLALGKMAMECGLDGLVCSPLEAAAFRRELGHAPLLITPGIRLRQEVYPPEAAPQATRAAARQVRPAGGNSDLSLRSPLAEADDQKRVATPRDAVRAGANFLVVGRPILEAADPAAATEAILRDMRVA